MKSDRSMPLFKNQKGQLVIEAVLLIVILLGLGTTAVRVLNESGFVAKMINGPWKSVQGMTECGVWGQPQQVCKQHPNNIQRSLTYTIRI